MKKTQLFKVASLMAITMLLLASCSKDEPKSEYDEIEEYGKYKKYYDALFNTSWKVEEMRGWSYRDEKLTREYDELQENFDRFGGDEMTITFTNKEVDGSFDVVCNLWPDAESRGWYITDPYLDDYDKEFTNCPDLGFDYYGNINGEYAKLYMPYGLITEFTPNRIVIDYTRTGEGYKFRYRNVLTRVANPSQDNNQQSK